MITCVPKTGGIRQKSDDKMIYDKNQIMVTFSNIYFFKMWQPFQGTAL